MTVNTQQQIDQLARQITAQLHLAYISTAEVKGNVCFANQPGLRPEYRENFTYYDLLDYLYAVVQNHAKQQSTALSCTTNADTFWQWVQTGHRLREADAMGNAEAYQLIDNLLQIPLIFTISR